MKQTAAIVGGAGHMGSYFADLLRASGFNIVISDLNVEKGRALARDKGYKFMPQDEFRDSRIPLDMLMFSVMPIQKTYGLIPRLAQKVKMGGLLTDLTSVKMEPVKCMLKHAHEGVAVIGMHPMFGPNVSMEGQRVILTPGRDNDNNWQSTLEELVTNNKGIVKVTSPEDHDSKMAVIQGLTHSISMIALETLRKTDQDLSGLMDYSSPIYRMLFAIMARTTAGDAELYSGIQFANPLLGDFFKQFIASFTDHQRIVEGRDDVAFAQIYDALRDYSGPYAEQAAKSLDMVSGKPKGGQLFFEAEHEKRIRDMIPGKCEEYGIFRTGEDDESALEIPVLCMPSVDPGHFGKLKKNYSVASYRQLHDRSKRPSNATFLLQNTYHPLQDSMKIRFTSVHRAKERDPEKKPGFPGYEKILLPGHYSDPILNLLHTVREKDYLWGQIPPVVVTKVPARASR